MKKSRANILRLVLAVVLVFVIIKLLIITFFDPITTTFNITVNTERIDFTTLDKNNSRFILLNAEIANEDEILATNFFGSLEFNKGAKVTIERVAFGPISIIVESETNESIGKLYNGEDGSLFYEAEDFLEVYIYDVVQMSKKGQTFIFSLGGDVNIGRSVNFEIFGESTALLRSGEVKMIGKTKFMNDYFEAGSELLNLGDRLVFDSKESGTYGFVTVNENPGMRAAYRVTAKEARIVKPGPQNEDQGYIISASFLDRLVKDKMFQGISVVAAALMGFFTIISEGGKLLKKKKKD